MYTIKNSENPISVHLIIKFYEFKTVKWNSLIKRVNIDPALNKQGRTNNLVAHHYFKKGFLVNTKHPK